MLKQIVVAAFTSLVFTSGAFAQSNTAVVVQTGVVNSSTIAQRGPVNTATTVQFGVINRSATFQRGAVNAAAVGQVGVINRALIVQRRH